MPRAIDVALIDLDSGLPSASAGKVWITADEDTGRLATKDENGDSTVYVTQDALDAAIVGLWDDRGTYDASGDVYPSTGGSGTAGAVLKGDIWTISVGGTLGGTDVEPGDTVRALVDAPGQTAGNWAIAEVNLGYVPLDPANNLSDVASASTSRTNLGLGTIATQDATNVNITGGSISGVTLSGTVTGYVPTTATANRVYGTDSGGSQTQFPVTAPGKGVLNASSLSAVSFQRINADDTATLRLAADFRTDLGLGTADDVVHNTVQLGAGSVSACSVQGPSDPNCGFYFPAADQIGLVTSGVERGRIVAQRLVWGHTASISIAGQTPPMQNFATGNAGQTWARFSNDTNPPIANFGKSRGASIGSWTAVQSADGLGEFRWGGADGTDGDTIAARMRVVVDGTVASDIVPGKWEVAVMTAAGSLTTGITLASDLSVVFAGAMTVAGKITQNSGLNVGYLEIPQNAQTGNYTLVLADSGKHIYHASGAGSGDNYTIPANASVAYPIGTTLTFVNRDSNTVAIAINSDTMYLSGTTTTGTRTLAENGVATAIKVDSTVWIISGNGLT